MTDRVLDLALISVMDVLVLFIVMVGIPISKL